MNRIGSDDAAGCNDERVKAAQHARWHPGAAVGLAALILLAPSALTPRAANAQAQPAAATPLPAISCASDVCDDGLWKAARGAADEISYWGMGAGHNCTNYVAWKLIGNGVTRPNIALGDAAQWDASAVSNGIAVDTVPAVGSVAQWDAYASTVGQYGHVAYVEQVNTDGTILVSEDAWRLNSVGGPLTFRTVDAATVSHFIHFGDSSSWIREVTFETPRPVAMSAQDGAAVQLGDVAPSIPQQQAARPSFTVPGEPGGNPFTVVPPASQPTEATATSSPSPASEATPAPLSEPTATFEPTPTTGANPTPTSTPLPQTGESDVTAKVWQQHASGLLREPSAMSAVARSGMNPRLVFADGGDLVIATRTAQGWTSTATGIGSTADSLIAVDMGGDLPQVVSLDRGQLFLSAATKSGWQKMPTGLAVTGFLAALNVGGLWPTIMVAQDDRLFQVRRGMQGWQVTDTGLRASGQITAVMTGSVAQVFAIQDGVLQQMWADGLGWHKKSTGIAAHGELSAAAVGGAVRIILLEDGVVKEVSLDDSGWHKVATPIRAGAHATAVDIGQDHPLIIQAG